MAATGSFSAQISSPAWTRQEETTQFVRGEKIPAIGIYTNPEKLKEKTFSLKLLFVCFTYFLSPFNDFLQAFDNYLKNLLNDFQLFRKIEYVCLFSPKYRSKTWCITREYKRKLSDSKSIQNFHVRMNPPTSCTNFELFGKIAASSKHRSERISILQHVLETTLLKRIFVNYSVLIVFL